MSAHKKIKLKVISVQKNCCAFRVCFMKAKKCAKFSISDMAIKSIDDEYQESFMMNLNWMGRMCMKESERYLFNTSIIKSFCSVQLVECFYHYGSCKWGQKRGFSFILDVTIHFMKMNIKRFIHVLHHEKLLNFYCDLYLIIFIILLNNY
jgi:hypothetical protein